MRATDPYQHTADAALINVAEYVESKCIGDVIRATEEQTAENRADLDSDQPMTEEALRQLRSSSAAAYSRALAALRDDSRAWLLRSMLAAADAGDLIRGASR